MIEGGKVLVNGRVVKSSYEVKLRDKIKIIFPFREIEAVVEDSGVKILSELRRNEQNLNNPGSPTS